MTAAPAYKGEALLLLVAVSLVWAISAFLVEFALTALPPATISFVRLALAAAVLGVLVSLRPRSVPRHSSAGWTWRYGAIALAGQAVPFVLTAWAQEKVPPATTSILIATTPIFATALAWGFGDTRANRSLWLGVLLGLCGVIGFFGFGDLALADGQWLRYLALILSAVLFAVAGRWVAKLPHQSALDRGAFVARYSAAMLLIGTIVVDRPWRLTTPSPAIVITLLVLGVISSAFAYVAYYRLIAVGGLPLATAHHYLAPALALTLQALLQRTMPTLAQIVGLTAIAIGIFLIAPRPRRPALQRLSSP